MADDVREELLRLNQRLLDSIALADWETYQELCDPSLTAFEPEAAGQLVQGLEFHHFYFRLGPVREPHLTTMAAAQVRLLDSVAVVTYVRLNQRIGAAGPTTTATEETRVWHRRDGRWWHVHFHRS